MSKNRFRIWACIGGIAYVLLIANGCSKDAPERESHDSSPAQTGTTTAPKTDSSRDPLADAPSDWPAFMKWAEQKLEAQTTSVPLPTAPKMPTPAYPIVYLADPDVFGAAIKRCEWTPGKQSGGVLAELGPFRSDQPPSEQFKIQPARRATADGRDALELAISGFQVNRVEVGGIELTLRVPFGKYVCLSWSSIGMIYVPVESHDEAFSVRIPTDNFVEWSGPLSTLSLQTDGQGAGVIEIQKLRFLPRESSYSRKAAARSIRIGEDIRTSLYAHCPAEIRYENVPIPRGGRLRVGLGCVTETSAGSSTAAVPARFEIAVADGDETVVLERTIAPGAAWDDALAELGDWSGKTVAIVLRASSPDPEAIAFWGEPVVYQPIEKPELLVVYLIDTVAAEHVGFYGYGRDTMPRLAEAARGGVWFANAFSNSPRTIESIPDLMLSMPTERHGVYHSATPAPAGLVTLAEILRASGRATASFCTNVNAGFRMGMAQGFDTFIDKIYSYKTDADRTIPLEQTLAWIRTHRDRPMFIYVHTAEPHSPYTPPPGYAGRYDPAYAGRIDGVNFLEATEPRDVEHVRALYDEEIVYADARLGMFLDALRDVGLLDAATFLVTSDHGEEFLEHNNWEHGRDLHNENTRVPLVAFGPAVAARGRQDMPAQIFDVMPTILDLYGLPAPYELAGDSLLPVLRGTGRPAEDRRIFASNHNYRTDYHKLEYSMIANGRWKLVLGAVGTKYSRFMLFDVQQDPRERRNLLGSNPAASRRLIEELLRWRLAQHVYDAGDRGPTLIDPRETRDLKAMGYLDGDENNVE